MISAPIMVCARFPRKLAFTSLEEAEAQLKKYKAGSRENKKTLNRMHVYQCVDAPAHWHMGHDRRKWKRRPDRDAG